MLTEGKAKKKYICWLCQTDFWPLSQARLNDSTHTSNTPQRCAYQKSCKNLSWDFVADITNCLTLQISLESSRHVTEKAQIKIVFIPFTCQIPRATQLSREYGEFQTNPTRALYSRRYEISWSQAWDNIPNASTHSSSFIWFQHGVLAHPLEARHRVGGGKR